MFGPRQLALGLETVYYLPLHEIRYVMVNGRRMPDVQPAHLVMSLACFDPETARRHFASRLGYPGRSEEEFEYWVREGRPVVTLDDEGKWQYV